MQDMQRCKVCNHKVQVMMVTQEDENHKMVEVPQVEARWMPYWCVNGERHTV